MKIDAMTGAAVGFAAFAAWFVLRPRAVATPANGSDVAYGMASTNRRDVGNNVYQNTDWILTGLTPDGFKPNVDGVPRTGTYTPWEG